MVSRNTLFTAALAALIFGYTPAQAAETFTADQKTEIEKIIKSYMLENGNVILDSVEAFREKEEAKKQQSAADNIKENIEILTSADAPSAGNENPDVTIIEFFDYNCGYCKRALSDVQSVLESDSNVRVVFREMPILGPSSLEVAKWALAAHKQGKYFEYHTAIMEHRGEKSQSQLKKIAEKLGLDSKQLQKDAESDEISEKIKKDLDLARLVGVDGTPAFIVGDKFYPGYLGEDGLKSAIETARKKSDKKDE